MAVVDIPLPAVFEPFLQPSRYKGAFGGRGGTKSHGFADLVIERCLLRPGTRVVCAREYQRSLEQSVKRLLEDKIQAYGLGRQFRVLNTHIETPGEGLIIFQGLQSHTAESIKSLEAYDVAWVEEAQSLSQRSLDLLRPTIRSSGSELWFSWNPRFPTDPVDDFFRGNAPRKHDAKAWEAPPDAIVVQTSYRDNPWLTETLRAEMEWDRSRDLEKYAHVWLGEYERHAGSRVFTNWRVEEFETPAHAAFLFGCDWGFAIDPTVLARGYVEGRNLFIDYEAYKVGCDVDDTPALFDSLACTQRHRHAVRCSVEHGQVCKVAHADEESLEVCRSFHGTCAGSHCDAMARGWEVVADSARPETISYMVRHGYPRIVGARKGPGSVEEGINFLKSYDIIVHPRCVHTVDEFTNYCFKKHPLTDEVIPVLEDKKNHVIDSLRYLAEKLRGRAPGDYGVTV